MATVGYSGTPLAKKLGIKPGAASRLRGAQVLPRFSRTLPEGVPFEKKVSESIT